MILSVGTVGCNCVAGSAKFGRSPTGSRQLPFPKNLVELADNYRAGNISLKLYLFGPLVWYEYVYDTARLAREKGLKNVLVTNGYLTPEPLRILPFIDE